MRRIKVIANKTWEADPLIDAMLNRKFKPRDLPYPIYVNQPPLTTWGVVHIPRLVYEFDGDIVEVWCLEDQMNPKVSGSSTHEKVRVLPEILLKSGEPDLVIAFGTAGSPDPNKNGGVSCGPSFYLHDGRDPQTPIRGTAPSKENAMSEGCLSPTFLTRFLAFSPKRIAPRFADCF